MGFRSSAPGRGVPVAQIIRLADGVKNAMACISRMQVALIVLLSLIGPPAMALDNLDWWFLCVNNAGQVSCQTNNGVTCSPISDPPGSVRCTREPPWMSADPMCMPFIGQGVYQVYCDSYHFAEYDCGAYGCGKNFYGLKVDLPSGRMHFPDTRIGGHSSPVVLQPTFHAALDNMFDHGWTFPLSITNYSIDSNDFEVLSSTCNEMLVQLGDTFWGDQYKPSCELKIRFTPHSVGQRTGNLRIETDSEAGALIVPLVGTGVSSSTGAFGSSLSYTPLPATPVDVAADGYVYLWNESTNPLNYAIALSSKEFQLLNDECRGVLPPETFCALQIRFTPAYEGSRSAAVTFSGDGFSVQDTLVGQGLARVVSLSASQGSLDFHGWTVGTSATAHLKIINDGNVAVTIQSIGIDPADGKFAVSNTSTCLQTLAPKGSCELTLAFFSAQPGLWSATLNIASPVPGSPLRIALSGRANLSPTTVTVSTPRLMIGRTPVGARSALRTVTLTNTGANPLWVQSSADVSLGTCGPPTAPGDQCTVLVSVIATDGVFSVPVAIPVNTLEESVAVQVIGLGDGSTCP